MAQKTLVLLEDDLEGGEAAETVTFALDGASYEIDLNEINAKRLRASLEEFAASARKVTGGTSRKAPAARRSSRVTHEIDPHAVRAWAASNGIQVSARGRLSASVIEQYRAAGN